MENSKYKIGDIVYYLQDDNETVTSMTVNYVFTSSYIGICYSEANNEEDVLKLGYVPESKLLDEIDERVILYKQKYQTEVK